MSNLKTAAQILIDIKELLKNDRSMFRIDIETREDGRYRMLYVGHGETAARIKIGEGSLRDFR